MKSAPKYWENIQSDPKKLKRVFTFIWVVSYSMLMLGAFLIIWIFLFG